MSHKFKAPVKVSGGELYLVNDHNCILPKPVPAHGSRFVCDCGRTYDVKDYREPNWFEDVFTPGAPA